MKWLVLAASVVAVTCLPIDEVEVPATELLPPKMDDYAAAPQSEPEDGPTLATDLLPPPLPQRPATLYLINVYAVKNGTAEESNDVLHDDVIQQVPDEIAEPLALFLLVVEDEDEKKPVSLDEVAKDLEEEGFAVERVVKAGQTRVIKVDLNSAETPMMKIERIDGERPLEESGKLTKIRRRRSLCLKCKLEELKMQKYYGGGGGCGGGCGGGGGYYQPQPQPVYQPVIVAIPVQQGYGKSHHGGGGHYPPQQQQQCNTCGGYGQGGGSSYAQASASASAQSYG